MLPITVAAALVLALAAMPAAHAQIDLKTGGASPASTAKAGEAASLGGAVFSPFVESSKSGASTRNPAQRALPADEPDLTPTLVVVLAAAAALGWIVRRAWNAD